MRESAVHAIPGNNHPVPRLPSLWDRARATGRVLQVRLRFLVVLVIVFLVVGKWDALRNYWHWAIRSFSHSDTLQAVAVDTEYFCPMCPGVISDWPSKCPVCNMALVRRQRGDATPLPSGAIPRMQFSPYRMQLAGIQTAPVNYRQLLHEIELFGVLEGTPLGRLWLQAEVSPNDLPLLRDGLQVRVQCATSRGHADHVGRLRLVAGKKPVLRAQIEIDDPGTDLRPALFAVARVEIPADRLPSARQALTEEWRTRVLLEGTERSALACCGLSAEQGLEPLLQSAFQHALLARGWILAIPESAVVDTGERQVTYMETSPGMFEASDLTLGPRCGGYYPVFHGLGAGQTVASAGAFLIDAETRLNPSLAASYFGASRSLGEPAPERIEKTQPTLSDAEASARQKKCPVTDEELGSMGPPVKVAVDGQVVFLCCRGCESTLRKEPGKYLAKLRKP